MRQAIVIVLLLSAAACGDKGQQTEAGPPPDTAGGKPDLSHPDVGARVLVTMSDSAIKLSHDSVDAVGTGQITFAVENKGAGTTVLEIDGGDSGKWTTTPIPGGQTVLMSMLMDRGSYQLYELRPDTVGTTTRTGLKTTIVIR